jgi:hypothetical protein
VGKRLDRKNDEHLRTLLAQQAARLIHNHGIESYRTAKHKAAESLGVTKNGALPTNLEIEHALAEHNRIFLGEHHDQLLTDLRIVALSVMQTLQAFAPRLVGSVLSGNVTEHSTIKLHLFNDAAESVSLELEQHGIHHSSTLKQHRFRQDLLQSFPGYRFFADNCSVEATVFTERHRAQAPLCPINGKPMRRAKPKEVALLVSL